MKQVKAINRVNILFYFLFILLRVSVFAQNNFTAIIKDAKTKLPLIGANVYFDSLKIGGASGNGGFVSIKNIPDGKFVLTVSYVGYKKKKLTLNFLSNQKIKPEVIYLLPEEIKTGKVIITSTRTNGVISSTPIKVEVLGQDEVNEEVAIRPANISKLLSETSGVILRQTSPVTGTVSFRLEGLPGRYTQLLKDGLPLLNGFSSGLTLLQIPPLDLQQVEIVKGASSIFYGNGAIAGFVNIITRKPGVKPEFDLVLNRTSRKGTDISSFYSGKTGSAGFTLLASFSRQEAVDVSGNGFTDIPQFEQLTINPKFFVNINRTSNLELGINAFYGNRIGGDIRAIKNNTDSIHSYFERNKSNRYNTMIKFSKTFNDGSELFFKNNIYYFKKFISISNAGFSGREIYSFSELSYLLQWRNHKFITGLNYMNDNFKELNRLNTIPSRNYNYNHDVLGIFLQDNWRIGRRWIIQPAVRWEFNRGYSSVLLSHISMIYNIMKNLNVRFSYGTGYNIPNILRLAKNRDIVNRNIEIIPGVIKREIATSLNFDLGYKLIINDFVLKINQAFFYTLLNNAATAQYDLRACPACGGIYFNNSSRLTTKGFDTNIYFALDELEFFADYSYNDVRKNSRAGETPLELTPEGKLNLTLTYEEEDNWRSGIEAFFTGRQYLPAGGYSRSYWIFGIMFQKMFKNFSVILNVENLTNERQSKYGKVVFPPYSNPDFSPLYMPLDGIVGNIALWIKLR